jgi:hypothetical protein
VLVVEWYQEKKHRIQRRWNRIRNGLDQNEKCWNHTQSKAKSRIKKENEPDAKRVDIKTQNSPVSQTQKTPNSNNTKKVTIENTESPSQSLVN